MSKYGCHCDLEDGQEPDECVIDRGDFDDCIYAKLGTSKRDCTYWMPAEETKMKYHIQNSSGERIASFVDKDDRDIAAAAFDDCFSDAKFKLEDER